MKEGRRPDPSWSCRPGRPRRTWVDQVRDDAGIPLSTLWSTPQKLPEVMGRRDGLLFDQATMMMMIVTKGRC